MDDEKLYPPEENNKDDVTSSDEYLSEDEFEDDTVVPDDENIDQRFRTIDEVTESFNEEKLLGPNTYRSVQNVAELAKQGKTLSKHKGRSRDLS